jgi:alkylation response protein AidB-like acyl-CoA dehydrogenase
MNRNIFEKPHELFRDSFRRSVAEGIVPHHDQWEQDGEVSREVWRKAGVYGFLCMSTMGTQAHG